MKITYACIGMIGIILLVYFGYQSGLRHLPASGKESPTKITSVEQEVSPRSALSDEKSDSPVQTNTPPGDLKEIIQNGYKNGASKANDAMESFLKNWNPVGHSVDELKAIFGKPTVEKNDSIGYYFDAGLFGWAFEFKLHYGKVSALERRSID